MKNRDEDPKKNGGGKQKKTGIDGATLFSGSQWCNVLLRNVPVQKMAQLDYITVDASDLVEKTGETSSVQRSNFGRFWTGFFSKEIVL